MRYFLLLILFVQSSLAWSTPPGNGDKLVETVSGSIHLPAMYNISVTASSSTDFVFDNWESYRNGIVRPSALHSSVRSTRPWIMSVSCPGGRLTNVEGKALPSERIKIRPSFGGVFTAVTAYPQVILQNTSNHIIADNDFDLKVDAPLDYSGTAYSGGLVFSLSAP